MSCQADKGVELKIGRGCCGSKVYIYICIWTWSDTQPVHEHMVDLFKDHRIIYHNLISTGKYQEKHEIMYINSHSEDYKNRSPGLLGWYICTYIERPVIESRASVVWVSSFLHLRVLWCPLLQQAGAMYRVAARLHRTVGPIAPIHTQHTYTRLVLKLIS